MGVPLPSGRTAIYVALSGALSLPFLVDAYLRPSGNATLWVTLAGVNLALWSSWPRYRSVLLQQAALTLSLLVIANLILSPFVLAARPEAAPTLPPNLSMHVEIVGDALPGVSGTQSISTDARGYRTNRPINYEAKSTGVLRIFAFGGSTTEEVYLDDRETWTFLLGERLAQTIGTEVEIVNTGVSGLRARQNLQAFVASEPFGVDVAIFMLGINDWNGAITAHHAPRRGWLLELKKLSFFDSVVYRGLVSARDVVLAAIRPASQPGPVSRQDDGGYYSGQNNSLARARKVGFGVQTVDESYAEAVRGIMDECTRRLIRCVFIDQATAYEPDVAPDLERRFWMTPPNQPYTLSLGELQRVARLYNGWLAETARAKGFTFCALAGKVPPTTEYFYDDCHFNENGARLVSRLIADCLRAEGLAKAER